MIFKTNLIGFLQNQRTKCVQLDAETALHSSTCMTALPEQAAPDDISGDTNLPVSEAPTNLAQTRVQCKRPVRPDAYTAPSARQLEMLQLLALPNGIRCSVLASTLGWKIPSVRAAICILHAAGHWIETTFSSKHKETVYRSCKPPAGQGGEGRERLS